MEVLQVHIEEAGYDNQTTVLQNVSFQVERGQLRSYRAERGRQKYHNQRDFGSVERDEGNYRVFGERKAFAYIPEHPILYDDLTLWEHLELTASVYEMEERIFQERAEALLKQFRLEKVKHHLPGSFSKGMQQKMMLIIGFLNRPDVYIVDEPFIGLDPYATKDLLHMLETERERGVPILMSTHVLDTAERVCDRFVLISNGTLAAEGTLDQIRDQAALPSGTLLECFHEILQQKGMGGLPDS
ncbi:ABC transporter ATP-binding protein [Paenibacillus larvae]|nr:ABC transporter ATP-binding protein [Paenibacillus larvae]MDT2258793.1 ABC transporter ATP-binding protein [Paenibacillus larvae]